MSQASCYAPSFAQVVVELSGYPFVVEFDWLPVERLWMQEKILILGHVSPRVEDKLFVLEFLEVL